MKRKRSFKAKEVSPSGTEETIDLDQLIEDRKQEKQKALKEELQKKLSTIRDRRTSGMSNKPFPEDAFERFKRNNILGNILEYLTDPTDIADTYFACRTFSEILEERRMLMTLPKVLSVFKKKVDDAFEFEGEDVGNTWYQKWHKICLDVRKVCKAWKKTVDLHSDITWDNWMLIPEWGDPDPNYSRGSNVFIFKDVESVDTVTSTLTSKGLLLSPIRALFVSVNDHISESYRGKLMEYFMAYGSSVRFIDIVYARRGRNIASSVRESFLCGMLKYMKNLKRLEIMFYDNYLDDEEMPEVGGAFHDIQQGLNEYEVPSLESLEHFSCDDIETESFLSQFLRKCVNLKSVDLGRTEPAEVETTDALMELKLERFHGLPSIITSNQMTWPLTHLVISRTKMNASVLFPAINRFRDTLQQLSLRAVVKMDENVSLELPLLQSIFIFEIRRGTLGFDDVLSLKSLENIAVERPTSVKYEKENALVKVKRYFDRGEMHMSNIWKCFPNLKRFQIQLGSTYYRPTQA